MRKICYDPDDIRITQQKSTWIADIADIPPNIEYGFPLGKCLIWR
jgi:hypothetical protein